MSFDVFNFTESADNKSIAVVSLNDTFTPTTISINGQHVTVKLSNEPVARSGFIQYEAPPLHPRIYWQSGGGSVSDGDVWEGGSLPPPTTTFPLLFNSTLFHNFQPTMKGYSIFSLTTNVNTGSYTIISVNQTFAPTIAMSHGASGNIELISAKGLDGDLTTLIQGTLRSLGSGMAEFKWYMGSGSGQVIWRLGGTPPPLPPPPLETCVILKKKKKSFFFCAACILFQFFFVLLLLF